MQPRLMSTIAASLIMAGTVPAAASVASSDAPSAQAQGKSAGAVTVAETGEKKICKKLARSGTRMAEKTCLTKSEWKKVEAEG